MTGSGKVGIMLPEIINALYRLAYRMASPAWRLYLRHFGTRTQGAQVAVWNHGRVLLIRNSYRKRYVFPGGYIRNGESTAVAASRELREETGIAVPTGQLRFSFAWSYTSGRHEAHDDIYECRLDNSPALCIDNREVTEAHFVAPETALALPLERHVRHYLSPGH